MDKKDLLTIELFARLCRTTPRTIRFYDEKGLLKPVFVDEFTKYRYYHPQQAREFFRFKVLQEAHMPIDDIVKLEGKVTSDFLDEKLQEMEKELEERKKQLQFFRKMKHVLYDVKEGPSLFEKEDVGPFVLLCFTNEHGSYDGIKADSQKIHTIAQQYNIPVTNTEVTFYLEPFVYKPKDTKLEVCVVTTLKEIPAIELPKGYYLKYFAKQTLRVYTYAGPFAYSTLIFQRLHEQSKKRELLPSEMYFEIVTHGPWDKTSEYDYELKLCFPLMD